MCVRTHALCAAGAHAGIHVLLQDGEGWSRAYVLRDEFFVGRIAGQGLLGGLRVGI